MAPRAAFPVGAATAVGTDGENGSHLASPKYGERHEEEHESGMSRASHQKPNRTFVKYQKLDVSHSVASIAASEPPRTGSTQCG